MEKIFRNKVLWIVGALVLLFLFWRLPQIIAIYYLYWGGDGIRRILYEDLGFSDSWSSFISVVVSFFYGFAWIPLSFWTYRLLMSRYDTRQLVTAFLCWVIVYGHTPLLHAMFGTNACFNQRTGEPMKWYVESSDGTVTLYDSGGYDTATGMQKKPVSTTICSIYVA